MPEDPKPTSTNTEPIFVRPAAPPELWLPLVNFLLYGFSEAGPASRLTGPALRALLSGIKWMLLDENQHEFKGELSEAVSNLSKVQVGGARLGTREGLDQFVANVSKQMEAVKDPKVREEIHRKIRELPAEQRQKLIADIKANSPESARTLAGFAGYDFPDFTVFVRPMRAGLWCMFLCGSDPRVLIERARAGDRGAALDLVRIDKAFLHDACTTDVFKSAERDNDSRYRAQLETALKYKPSATEKQFCQLVIYLLLSLGHQLPDTRTLQSFMDPDGRIFPGIYAFQKYVQRTRIDFEAIETRIPASPGTGRRAVPRK
jgi:hypothetical protein